MAAPLGIGVIGAGGMGRLHATNVARYIGGAAVVAIADVDKARADTLAATLGTPRVYQDPLELIADSTVHAVVIASPAITHAELVVACARARKDTFCEKPLATTVESVREAGKSAADYGIRLQLGFNRRFDPTYVLAKQTIESGAIGTPLVYKGVTRDRQAPPRSFLALTARNGMLVDTAVHEFDAARWLLNDEVVRVQAMGEVLANPELADVQGPDAALVNLRFSRGGLGNVDVFWGVRYGDDVRAEVIGSKGSLLIGTAERMPVQVMTEAGLLHQAYPDHFDRFRDSYLLELTAFVGSSHPDSSMTPAGASDGIKAVEIALAAQASMESDMAPIELPL
jgi:scyllo-inositol 2-dehydrogenase (NAD+)